MPQTLIDLLFTGWWVLAVVLLATIGAYLTE